MKEFFQRDVTKRGVKSCLFLKWIKILSISAGVFVLIGFMMSQESRNQVVSSNSLCYPSCPCPTIECPQSSNPLNKWTFAGAVEDERLGNAIAGLRDLNCDGYADLIVGGYGYGDAGGYRRGRFIIFYGSSSGLPSYPLPPGAIDRSWQMVGDKRYDAIGCSCANAGDIDGDGIDDALVGAPYYKYQHPGPSIGRVYVIFGFRNCDLNNFEPQKISYIYGEHQGSLFGSNLASVGDVYSKDGMADGCSEFLVAAENYSGLYTQEGIVYLYTYNEETDACERVESFNFTGGSAYSHMGEVLASAGDVNGDGYLDIIIGAPRQNSGVGRVWVFYHTHDMRFPYDTGNPSYRWTAIGDNHSWFGRSVACAGKIVGGAKCEDFDSIIIGGPYFDVNGKEDAGKAFVYYGSPDGLGDNYRYPDLVIDGANAGDMLGTSVGRAGYVNDDEYDDVFVGAPGYGQYNNGRVYIFYGSENGLSPISSCYIGNTPNGSWGGISASAVFGKVGDNMFDLNGDCSADILIGGPFYNGGRGFIQVNYGQIESGCYKLD